MRVLITQPAQDSEATALMLRGRGHTVLSAPLIIAERLPSPKINLSAAQGFVVTGGEGARALADHVGVRTFPVFTDSEATKNILRGLGFQQILVAKDDTADLARLVERTVKPSAGALIHACSNGPATNLGALLGNMGFALRPLPLYSLKRATALPPEILAALRGEALDAAVFLSPEEARAFVALVQQEKLEGIVKNLATVAASPVVAAPLRALKFRGVTVPPGGALDDIAAALDGALVDKVEEQRAAVEQRAREEAAREQAAAEAEAAKQAEAKRIAGEQAEQERARLLAAEEEKRKREQAAQAAAERERVAKEQERIAREARADADRKAKEEERQRRDQMAREEAAKQAEAKRIAQEQASAERDAKREQQRLENEAHAAAKRDADEKARLIREQTAKEEAERKRAAEEQTRVEREAKREADEKARLARELASKEEAERRRVAEEQARLERDAKREQQRLEDEARATAKREVDEAARRAREQVAKEEAERKRVAEEKAQVAREQRRLEEETRAAARRAAEETARLAREQAAREETERRRIAEEQARVEREAKLEQQRLEDEAQRVARGEADEKARLARERAARQEAERRRIADEQARLEREAKREQQRLEDEARAKAKRETEEQERLARIARERQREEQAAQERVAREEAERRADAGEAARLAADAERLAREQAAREEATRTVLERKRAQAAFAAQERAFSTQVQTDEAAREALARQQRESEQRAAEQARADALARQEKRRRAEEEARAEAERGRQLAEAAEQQRQKDEAAAFAKAQALKAAKAEQDARAAARAAQDEVQRIAAEERRAQKATLEDAQKPAVRPPALATDSESAPVAPPAFGAGLKSWWAKTFAGASSSAPASPTRPSWAMIRDDNPSERTPETASPPMVTEATLLRDVETPPPQVLAPAPASATMASIPDPGAVGDGAVRADEPQTPQPENQPEVSPEPQPVSQPLSSDIPESSDASPAPIRTAESARGGRAARLLAEDAADDKARGQRFKNYSFGENTEAPAENERPAAPRRRSRAPMLFLVLVVLTVGAYLSSSWWMAKLTPMPRTPVTAQTAAGGDELAALAGRVRALEDKAAGAASAADLAAMRKSLAEQAPPAGTPSEVKAGEVNESLANQGRQVAALTARLATLEAAIGNAARLDELNKRMSTLESKSADATTVLTLSERVNALEGAGRSVASAQAGAVAYVMALGQWQNALASGRPFALELETAKALALRGNTTINDVDFASYAANGLPTFIDLQARFDAVAAATVRAAAVPDDTASWLRRVLDRIMSIATIRRVDGDVAGNSAWAIVARAESRLGQNDLSGAVTEMEKLQGEAARVATAWVGPARARIKAERTLGEATTKAIAAVAAAGDKPSN